MTDQQIIERLAEFMGWEKVEESKGWRRKNTVLFLDRALGKRSRARSFYPLTDWNHFRKLEEKIMEDWKLSLEYTDILSTEIGNKCTWEADLPTRCKALISILPK